MTNEEKAREIANLHKITYIAGLKDEAGTSFIECLCSSYQMAKWKDQQFKEYLEKKKADIMGNPYSGHCLSDMTLMDEITNELFGGE